MCLILCLQVQNSWWPSCLDHGTLINVDASIGFGATLKVGGGGRIMRVKQARGRALCVRRGMLPLTDNFLRMALPALVLGVLLAVCCYFSNLGNALLCESYYFSTTNYANYAGCSSK